MDWQYAVKYATKRKPDFVTRFKFPETFIIKNVGFQHLSLLITLLTLFNKVSFYALAFKGPV